MATVTMTRKALQELELLPVPIVARIGTLLERLEKWPEVSGAKALRGNLSGHWRLRTGDYRVQFRVDGESVTVEKVGHRDRFYEEQAVTDLPIVQTLTVAGERFVLVPEAQYRQLIEETWEPALPEVDARGNYPAVEAARVVLARKIIRRRHTLGLTQAELAQRAGVRVETLSRLEHAKHTASAATADKIATALEQVEMERRARTAATRKTPRPRPRKRK